MQLAKDTIDVGLFTTSPDEVIAFWKKQAGAVDHSSITIAEGHQQHRLEINGSLLKINAVAELQDRNRTGYAELIVVRDDVEVVTQLVDPDGNHLTIGPAGHRGVQQLGLVTAVADVNRHGAFLKNALGLEQTGEGVFAVGRSSLILDAQGKERREMAFNGPGYRYVSIESSDILQDQVDYVAGVPDGGWNIQQIGTAVRFAIFQDTDGNWLEVVQRAAAGTTFESLNG